MQALSLYIRKNDLTQVGFARQLGISDAFLSQILSGVRKPGIALTKRIEEVTGISRTILRPDVYEAAQ